MLSGAWELVEELVSDDDIWAAIEWLAGIVEGVRLDGVAVSQIIDGDGEIPSKKPES